MPSRRNFLKQTAGFSALALAMNTTTNSYAEEGAATQSSALVTLPDRKDVPIDATWNLSPLFANDDDWKKQLEETRRRLAEFKMLEGKLSNADTVLACFKLEDSIGVELERLTIYAYLRSSEDVANSDAQNMQSLIDALQGQVREAMSFIHPELLAIDENTWNSIADDSKLAPYTLKLYRIVRQKPHILLKDGEQMLAQMTEVSQTAAKAFGLLNDADIKFGSVIDETGKSIELTTGSFSVFMNAPDRKVRETAFKQFYAGYESLANTLSSLLSSSIQKDVFFARVRKHPSALDSALFYPEIPRVVYDNLITTVNKFLPVLHRYYEIRRRKMGLDTIHMYDTYNPILSEVKTNYSWDEGTKIVGESLSPLGEEYVRIVMEGMTTGRWCDRYENRGKRSGAFCYGSYGTHPYIMMNYKPTVLNSLFTLTHEAGHAMHSFYSARTQPFTYFRYSTFVAEVASTFNEDLLARYLLSQTTDKGMRACLINRQIDGIRNTLFRQTMFAEFEQRTHEAAETGESLTARSMRTMYRKLLDAYFGPKFTIDEALETECFRVPHFYRAFYVYQYATGISAALSLAERVMATGSNLARNNYLRFLEQGGYGTPIEQLRIAGVDMESPKPIVSAMKRFEQLVAELDELI